MRPELPTGTVTFLFTDVEGSTQLLSVLGAQRYADALAEHRRLLREAFTAREGVEVDTQGDAFFYAFPTAPGAVAAAKDGQQALLAQPISVRMGVHTGTPLLATEGYVGMDVHRAARIAAVAHGGQVVVSATTAALTEAEALRDLGEHRLKDLSGPVRLYQLGHDDFPPLRSLYRTNLPVPVTPFLGRERELAEVTTRLLNGVRLLTLTGAGGSGKTRLALQAAAAVSDIFPDGIYWVPLATLRDPQLVADAAAQALGADDLAAHIDGKGLLLYFDNFEHVVEGAGVIGGLIGACPNLTVLVTSREPLHLTGEQEYPVPPFVHQEGVGFFMARARAIDPDFAGHPAVAEICARLDNLPLALELAAARVKSLPPAQLLVRLDQRLPLLTGGAQDLPERQQTLRGTISWSHDLLNEEEQQAFRALAIFVGGCTLAGAEEVARVDLDTLQSLLDKSLLRRSEDRYWMLETIREFALDQLRDTNEYEEIARRHYESFAALAESACLTAEQLGEAQIEVANAEVDNLRAAIDWAASAGEYEKATLLAVSLEQFWVANSPHEGARRLATLLDNEHELSPLLRARAMRVRAGTAFLTGAFEEALLWSEAALAAFRELGDNARAAHMLIRIAIAVNLGGDPQRARELAEESRALHRGSAIDEAQVLYLLGNIAFSEGRGEQALELLARSANLAAEIGSQWWRAAALLSYADYALKLGRTEAATAPAREVLETARLTANRQHALYALVLLAWRSSEHGQFEHAGLLWGAVEAEAERTPVGQWEGERAEYTSFVVRNDPAFQRGHGEGKRLTFDRAIEEALAQPE